MKKKQKKETNFIYFLLNEVPQVHIYEHINVFIYKRHIRRYLTKQNKINLLSLFRRYVTFF